MSTQTFEVGRPIYITNAANATLPKGTRLLGVFCSSSTSGTIKLDDGTNTLVDTVTLVAGTWHRLPLILHKDTTVTVGGTLKATLVVVEG